MDDQANVTGGSAQPGADPDPSGQAKQHGAWVPRWRRILVGVFAVIGVIALVVGVVGSGLLLRAGEKALESSGFTKLPVTEFYTPPEQLPAVGELIKSEPVGYDVPGGTGLRFMYTSAGSDGQAVPVSGLVFIPEGSAPAEGRPVVGFAHGTVGTPAGCAPSLRTSFEQLGYSAFLEPMLQKGFVVVATDYVGMGIPAPSTYLLGDQEARDVVYSVTAARDLDGIDMGERWVVHGTSQGGNSALWTADLAAQLAPDLPLVGVMAVVPAAELGATLNAQWDQPAAWAIGPELLASWENAYPGIDFRSVLSSEAVSQLSALQDRCVVGDALVAELEAAAGNQFFASNPADNPDWARIIREQTPPPPDPSLPMFLVQGTGDQVVLAGSNALLQEQWCAQGRPMTSLWLGGVSHQSSGAAGGPSLANWAEERFAGVPAVNSCGFGVPAPVVALDNPIPREN